MATLDAGELLPHSNDAYKVGGFESLQRPHHPRLHQHNAKTTRGYVA